MTPQKRSSLQRAIQAEINKVSAENGSDTPDFILAEFLTGCLETFNRAVVARERWYGRQSGFGVPVEVPSGPPLEVPKTPVSEPTLEVPGTPVSEPAPQDLFTVWSETVENRPTTTQYSWLNSYLNRDFGSWAELVGYAGQQGYQLVPSNHRIPSLDQQAVQGFEMIYFMRDVNHFDVLTGCSERLAGELGYPVFFKK